MGRRETNFTSVPPPQLACVLTACSRAEGQPVPLHRLEISSTRYADN